MRHLAGNRGYAWNLGGPRRQVVEPHRPLEPAAQPVPVRDLVRVLVRRYDCGFDRAASVAAPMMPALFRSVAGMIGACRSSSGRNSSWCFDTPPPTTKSSGESSASSVE